MSITVAASVTRRVVYFPRSHICKEATPAFKNKVNGIEVRRTPLYRSSTYNITIENYLSRDIWVGYRNGTFNYMPSIKGIQHDKVVLITLHQVFSGASAAATMVDMVDTWGTLTHNVTPAVKATYEAVSHKTLRPCHDVPSQRTEYVFREHELENDPKGLYLEELDLVISLDGCFPDTLHPGSDAAKRYHAMIAEETALAASIAPPKPVLPNEEGMYYIARIVDNSARYQPRFMRLGKNVFLVPSTKEPENAEGVYIKYRNPLSGPNADAEVMFMSMEAAEAEIPLYKTQEEAHTAPEALMKAAEVEIQKDTLSLKQRQLEESQHRLDVESERLKIEREKTKDDVLRREHDSVIRKESEVRQRRNAIRNEIIDVGKMLVTLVGFYVTCYKLKK